jgi:putative hydrolase
VIDGIRLFKGIEASILNIEGVIDLPIFKGYPYEIILVGLHNHDDFEDNPGFRKNTEAVVNAMKNNPGIKILTHPYYDFLPLDLDAVTDMATEKGIALEVNNSYLLTKKANEESLAYMLELALKKGTKIAVNSDGHVFSEIGEFGCALGFMEPFGLDNFTIVNRTLESTLEFLGLGE